MSFNSNPAEQEHQQRATCELYSLIAGSDFPTARLHGGVSTGNALLSSSLDDWLEHFHREISNEDEMV
ncbi:hypothetical protein F2Q70_00022052 [Brassica cretica]|uniref:Uncharacterized protein n=2 Tax=Brassica cretica TaxID=69181 RepID=A0A8S9HKU8_BRACR|nr:hypothetical protein F2Q70_00022052 [Brassica cretica]KAF2557046.1 hypothetical protein F2Q68_00015848 [Brassica cretica]KAF3611122.1 hypothetical protein DY000_02048405 [Brassica cretica]